MFGIGLPEMLLIMALALIVVGPDKLPDLARSVAKGLMELKKTAEELKHSLNKDNPLADIRPDFEEAAKGFKENLLELPGAAAQLNGEVKPPAENAAAAYEELMRHSPAAIAQGAADPCDGGEQPPPASAAIDQEEAAPSPPPPAGESKP